VRNRDAPVVVTDRVGHGPRLAAAGDRVGRFSPLGREDAWKGHSPALVCGAGLGSPLLASRTDCTGPEPPKGGHPRAGVQQLHYPWSFSWSHLLVTGSRLWVKMSPLIELAPIRSSIAVHRNGLQAPLRAKHSHPHADEGAKHLDQGKVHERQRG